MKPEAMGLDFGKHGKTLEELRQEHKELQCKDQSWYIENVDHEMNWEKDRICHPFAQESDPKRCSQRDKALATGRWTVEAKDLMPLQEYKKAKHAAAQRQTRDAEL